MSIGVALLGAGVFAKREHLPAIKACNELSLKAIYSRSQKSAELFASETQLSVESYYNTPGSIDRSLDALLQRSDIQAVVIAVAISVAPDLIKKALAAGKHVLSEKPIAPDIDTAIKLIEFHNTSANSKLWAVGENFRFWNNVHKAAQLIKELNAELQTFSVACYNFTDAKNPFFHSEWRQQPSFQGGYILDGGTHFVAVLRILLAALGRKVTTVSAFTSLLQKNLPPIDTLHAILRTDDGRTGSYICSVGLESKLGMEFEVVTNKGSIIYRPFQMHIATKLRTADGKWEEKTEPAPIMWGVKEEIAAFAQGITAGTLDWKLSAAEALEDLKIVEAMIKSGEQIGVPINIA